MKGTTKKKALLNVSWVRKRTYREGEVASLGLTVSRLSSHRSALRGP